MINIIIKVFIIYLITLISLFSAEPWDQREIAEIEGFTEIDEKFVISFKDAIDGAPLSDANVTIKKDSYKTDNKGYIYIPTSKFANIDNDSYPMEFKKPGYITTKIDLIIQLGSIWNKRFVISRQMNIENIRIVLQWGAKPRDLDLHLVTKEFHVSYRNLKNIPNKANLDRDDKNGYGPETLTLNRIEKGITYRIYVHNFSGESSIRSDGVVYVYANNKLEKLIYLPETSQKYILVGELIGNKFNYPNLILDSIMKEE
jgi:hypothetical protein